MVNSVYFRGTFKMFKLTTNHNPVNIYVVNFVSFRDPFKLFTQTANHNSVNIYG